MALPGAAAAAAAGRLHHGEGETDCDTGKEEKKVMLCKVGGSRITLHVSFAVIVELYMRIFLIEAKIFFGVIVLLSYGMMMGWERKQKPMIDEDNERALCRLLLAETTRNGPSNVNLPAAATTTTLYMHATGSG